MPAKMLRYHAVEGGEVSPDRFVKISDIHRIDACEKDVPVYRNGVRSFIRGRGKDGFNYPAHEEAADLIAQIENG